MTHYEIQSVTDGTPPIIFDWDEGTGFITGPGAAEIVYYANQGYVCTHPYPTCVDLSKEPLKSKRDLALILSFAYRLPPELAEHMPDLTPDLLPDGHPEVTY